MKLGRRSFCAGLTAAVFGGGQGKARAAPLSEPYELLDLEVPGSRRVGQRFALLVPKHLAAGQRVGLLVALHGLGETGDPKIGVRAWMDRYGLGSAYQRLRMPPIEKLSRHPYWPEGRLAELNRQLADRPFGGMAVACPYTPNVYKAPSRKRILDDYADWLVDTVLPRARAEAPVLGDAAHTSLDGCSLGGYVGIEVFLRKAEHFGAWGGVQAALGQHRVPGYAERLEQTIARVGPRPIHLETSDQDAFHDVNVQLARALEKRGVPHELRVGRGPHNQPWLREAGTLEMLLWHDRQLG